LSSRLLEAVDRQNEDDCSADADLDGFGGEDGVREREGLRRDQLGPSSAFGPYDAEDLVYVIRFNSRENGGTATAEEASGAADFGGGVTPRDELADKVVCLVVGGDDDEELLWGVVQAA
jgi:hypothetical protein